MVLEFNSSPRPTVGVEVEYQLVDPESRDLVQIAPQIFAAFPDADWVKEELLQSTIEINTKVCEDVGEVTADLEKKAALVREVAKRHGATLVAAGTHPFAKWEDQLVSPDERYHRLVEKVQWPARRLLIFGLHVHVGIRDGETAIAVANHLEPWLPHLLALSASSPFWEARDTGLASARIKIFETLPTAGLPHRCGSWHEFERLVEVMIRSQAIETIREIWWDIRPHHNFGTIEVRVCDAVPTLVETVALTALVQALVVWLERRIVAGEAPPILHPRIVQENKWRAARHGLRGAAIVDEEGRVEPISETLERQVEVMVPVFRELASTTQLPMIRQMLRDRPSFARQRAIFQESGELREVVDCLIRESEENRPFHI